MLLAATLALAAPLPAWRAAGPERGDVMDVAVLPDEVLVLSRPGVLKAGLDLTKWQRDPRFPANTRHLAAAREGSAVWAVTPRRLWRVGTSADSVAALPEGSTVVDLVGVRDGVLAAVRGVAAGVYRYGATGVSTRVLPNVDPWTLVADGDRVWAGTLDHGLYRSEDGGDTFAPLAEGSVSALALEAGDAEPIVAWADGRVTQGDAERCVSTSGPALAIGKIAGTTYLILDGARGPQSPPVRCAGGGPEPVDTWPSHEDGLPLTPTGLWPLPNDRLLLGTFRAGPMVVDRRGARFARAGFRSTLTAATTTRPDGGLLLALMSTGVFSTGDAAKTWRSVSGEEDEVSAPVTDVMDLAMSEGKVVALDFEGVTIEAGKSWSRSEGVADAASGRANALVELGVGEDGILWGRDLRGSLWRRAEAAWSRCLRDGVLRIEGAGSTLKFATNHGYLAPWECTDTPPVVWPELGKSLEGVRSDGSWAAGNGKLWHDGVVVGGIAPGPVEALAARTTSSGDEQLVVVNARTVLRCAAGSCAPAAQTLPGAVVAVGWLANGKIWAAEARGSLLVADADTELPAFAYYPALDLDPVRTGPGVAAPRVDLDLTLPPWRTVGRPTNSAVGAAPAPAAVPAALPAETPPASAAAGDAPTLPTGLPGLALGLLLGVGAGAAILTIWRPTRRGRRR